MTRTKKWDEMSWYVTVLARQAPEPEWYPAGLFGACISRSPKQNRSSTASKTKINDKCITFKFFILSCYGLKRDAFLKRLSVYTSWNYHIKYLARAGFCKTLCTNQCLLSVFTSDFGKLPMPLHLGKDKYFFHYIWENIHLN